jgi:hypothetical protein
VNEVASTVVQYYGPLAFGLIALLIIWRYIIVPELSASRSAEAERAKVAAALQATAETLYDAVRESKILLDRIATMDERRREK